MKREIILDTETTGLDPNSGHRMVEIGCVEVMGGIRTGEFFHSYLNPEREVPDEAFRVHGLSTKFLADKPVFSQKVDDFLAFIADSRLVIHNAAFDMKFVNYELKMLGFPAIPMERTLDTLAVARKKFPGAPASLDALCKRFAIDLSNRTKHGALLDAELLADVYLELLGGRQVTMGLETKADQEAAKTIHLPPTQYEPREFPANEEELAAHAAMVAQLKQPVWG
jgi:DNA polymerase-3 subunit epsilon